MTFVAQRFVKPASSSNLNFVVPLAYEAGAEIFFYNLTDPTTRNTWIPGTAPMSIGMTSHQSATQGTNSGGGAYVISDSGNASFNDRVVAGVTTVSNASLGLNVVAVRNWLSPCELDLVAFAPSAQTDVYFASYAGKTLQTYCGTFNILQSGASTTVTGLPFAPNDGSAFALICTATTHRSSGDTGHLSLGCATSPAEQWAGRVLINYLGPGGNGDTVSGALIRVLPDGSGVSNSSASLSALTSDGFTISSGIAPAHTFPVHYTALYDPDPTAGFQAGIIDWGNIGTHSVSGFGFAPEGLITGAFTNLGSAHAYCSFSISDGVHNNVHEFISVNDGSAGSGQRSHYTNIDDGAIGRIYTQTGVLAYSMFLNSLDADGFTYTSTTGTGPPSLPGNIGYLASRTSIASVARCGGTFHMLPLTGAGPA